MKSFSEKYRELISVNWVIKCNWKTWKTFHGKTLLYWFQFSNSHYFQHFNLYPVESSLAKNIFYRAIFKPIASILLILPVGLMLVLTCILSASVRRVNKVRQNLARLPTTSERPAKVSLALNHWKTFPFMFYPPTLKYLHCSLFNKSFLLPRNQFPFIDRKFDTAPHIRIIPMKWGRNVALKK